jgi:hypothetical protein
MNLLLYIFLTWLARTGLRVLGVLLVIISMALCLLRKFVLPGIRVYADPHQPAAGYWKEGAIVLDKAANVFGGPLWNLIMFKKGASPTLLFGSHKHTMSHVYGIGVREDTLNGLGRFICRALEGGDPGHLEDAIKYGELL